MKDMSKCKTLKEIANDGLIPKIIEEIMLEIKKNNLIYQNEKQFQITTGQDCFSIHLQNVQRNVL